MATIFSQSQNPNGGITYTATAGPTVPVNPYSTQNPISTSTIGTQPAYLPQAPAPVDYSGLMTSGSTMTAANNATLTPQQLAVQEAQGKADTASANTQGLLEKYLGIKPASATEQYNTDYANAGIDQKQADVNAKSAATLAAQGKLDALNAQLQGINSNAIAIQLQGDQASIDKGITAGGVGAQSSTALRNNALMAIPLQAQAIVAQAQVAAAQGNQALSQNLLEQATTHLDKMYEIHQQDATNTYNHQKDVITQLMNVANKKEATALEALKTAKEQEYQTTQSFLKTQSDLLKSAVSQGAPQSVVDAITNAKDENSAIVAAGKYGADLKAQELRQAQINAENRSNQGVAPSSGGDQYANDLDAIVGTVLSTIPSKFGQQTFNTQISKARDDADKLNIVAAQVLQGQPAEFKNDFRNQAVGIAQIDKAIAEIDKGVQTGVLQNAAQYAYNVVGKDFDPKLATINNYITSAIQPYRNSVTGAAWGEQEDGEYQQLFGSTRYSPTELKQRLVQTKELLKSKSSEGLNSFVNPLGNYENKFDTGTLAPTTDTPTAADTPAIQGFWGSIGNFLWGND